MSIPNIIAAGILILLLIIIVGIDIYKIRKNNNEITFDQFIDLYGDRVIAVLEDVIKVLQVNINDFEDQESYEKAIISLTIKEIKENSTEFGIDTSIINLFDTDVLTEAVYKIFNNNMVEIFSVLGSSKIGENQSLYKKEVVEALSESK